MLSARINKKECDLSEDKLIQRYRTDIAHFFEEYFQSELRFKRRNQRLKCCLFVNFVGSYFPTEKPFKKNTGACNTHTPFKKNAWSVSNICLNVANFPAKRLRKNTAPKKSMRQFFFFFENSDISVYVANKLNFSLVLYYHLLLVKSTAFLIFYCLSIYIFYSVNHKSKFQVQQSIYSFKLSSITGN